MLWKTLTTLLWAGMLIIPLCSHGQESQQIQVPDSTIMMAAREIMENTITCALITNDEKGFPVARAMDAFSPEEDFVVWMGTNSNSRKVQQIKNNNHVSVYYLADGSSGYVLLKGIAELIDDPIEKAQRWKPEWKEFYPEDRANYLLIKIVPISMEVVSYPHHILGDEKSWAPRVVQF